MAEARDLIEVLERLDRAMEPVPLVLDLDQSETGRATGQDLSRQINDYLLPRLRRVDAPLLVVLGGSTGSGKSTLTNSLVGAEVSPAGVLRPTTRAPVLICHPDDREWFDGEHILPELIREIGIPDAPTGPRTGAASIRIVEQDGIGPGLALIDAPDIDSVEEANRQLADQLLAAADMWLFATTAMRYADAVPWDFLHLARERGTALTVVVNRIPPGASSEILDHLQTMLDDAGLGEVRLFPIEQAELTDGLLTDEAIAPIRALLGGLAADAEARSQITKMTLDGALRTVEGRARQVLDAAEEQDDAVKQLRAEVSRGYGDALDRLADDIASGTILRNEVLERWQELVGTAELMQAVQNRVSVVRDRIGSYLRGRPSQAREVQGEITSTLEALLIDRADGAAADVTQTWRTMPGGRQALGEDRTLERCSPAYRQSVATEVRAWQDDILDLVRERGANKRTTARVLALGVNSIGVALMLVIFAQTGGMLLGSELAVGAGAAGVSQALLTAIFGEQAVRELAAEARKLLLNRVGVAMETDSDRFRQLLDGVQPTPEALGELRAAIAAFESAR
jgi:energy-coupling factor transporter ATP-binding protein EcfA2